MFDIGLPLLLWIHRRLYSAITAIHYRWLYCGSLKANSLIPCRSPAMPRPCRSESDLSRPQHRAPWQRHGQGMHVRISIGRPETACVPAARVRLLPVTTRSSTKFVTRSRLLVRIFPSTRLTFTKDTALSENGRGAVWCVWINAAEERHGKGMICVN
jgi:hypothetical protein